MTLDDWESRNTAYVTAALAWLRALLAVRLETLRGPAEPSRSVSSPAADPVASVDSEPPVRRGLFHRSSSPPALESVAPPQLPPANLHRVRSEALTEARAALEAASQGSPPPSALLLASMLGLSDFERDVLLLGAGIELDARVAGLCAELHGQRAPGFLTFALAFELFDTAAWEALSPERPLRYLRLVELGTGAPLTSCPLRVDERAVSFIKGLNYVDERLAQQLTPLRAPRCELPPSQAALAARVVTRVLGAAQVSTIVRLQGQDLVARRQVAFAACRALGITPLRLAVESLPESPAELDLFARLWQREHRLSPLALYLDAGNSEQVPRLAQLGRFLELASGLIFVDMKDDAALDWPDGLKLDVARPLIAEQRDTWSMLLPSGAEDLAPRLASQFDLAAPDIHEVAGAAVAAAEGELSSRLWAGCREKARPGLDSLAQRVDVKAGWDSLVLPEQERQLLERLAAQVRARSRVYDEWGFRDQTARGLGISALFAGESGVGKTLAAEVLASELDLDLYRIDLSAVVSKYIGETEKNLRRVFDAAEQGGAILFFDEADALFGKRSEVRDSHDRYANIEVNYLLQRMEVFRGLAILASNVKGALDTAFLRRLRFVVHFPHPSSEQRQRIWARALPAGVPREDLDYEKLSKLNLTGGHIHNIALNAAFLAAQGRGRVDMDCVLEAVRMELRKLGQRVNEAELRTAGSSGAAP
jgi:ATPase family associated with various cellular activities (AAA)